MNRIAKLETFTTEFVCFVRLTTDDGRIGWGQTSTYNADITATIFHRQVAPWALGADVLDVDGLIDRIDEREHKFPGSYRCRALAGLDTAMWDWRGRAERKPVVELIGGKVGRLRAYASSMKRDITPEDEAKRAAASRRSAPSRVGRLLEAEGISHYEEPCPYWKLGETKQVTEALSIDVTGGEQDCDLATWARIIEMRAVDIVQPDVMYMGGLSRTLRVARMAAAAGLPCTPHSANLSLVTVCTMHLLGAIANAGKYLELSIEGPDYYPWQGGLFRGDPFAVVDGHVRIPAEPGWGVEINSAWLERAKHQVSAHAA